MPLHTEYTPAPSVVEHCRHIDLTTVTGPAGVGKNTIMSLTGIPVVVSDTTRNPRSNDGYMENEGVEYWFRGDELEEVYNDIQNGDFVQWAPGPNDNIYGSRNSSYPQEGTALIDVVAKSIVSVRDLRPSFNSVESAYIVTPDYETWIPRLRGRGTLDPKDFSSRLKEAHSSLVFGLEDEEMHFIVNDEKTEAAQNLELLATRHESHEAEKRAKNCGLLMLRGLEKELGLKITYPLS